MGKKTADTRKQIKSAARSQVADIYAAETEDTQRQKMEEAFEDAKTQIFDLEEHLQAATKDNEKLVDNVENLKKEKEELEQVKVDLEAKQAELQDHLDEASKEVENLKKQIEDMEKDAAVQARASELGDLGLLSRGKSSDRQKARIRDMSEEEFADYKDELLALREDWEAEMGKKSDKTKDLKSKDNSGSPDPEEDENTEELEGETALESDEDDADTLSTAQLIKLRRAAAALNQESRSTANIDSRGVDLDLKAKFDALWTDAGEDK